LNIEDKSDVPEKIEVDWHPKDKTIGTRTQFRANKLLIEYDDAKEIVEGQKLTLYKWGNSLVTKVEKEGDVIKTITVKLTPEDLNFKKTKVVHWVPLAENTNAKVLLVEFDHLITVKKIEEDNKIEDVVNTKSRFETVALAEIEILNLKKGDFVQLERRGYYYVDKDTSEGMMTLHFIPDGKSKAVSVVSMKVDAKKIAKGEDEGEGKKKKEKKKEENKKENKEKKENKPVETKIEETNTEENKN
jgi:glutamyl-tRNA synthetase